MILNLTDDDIITISNKLQEYTIESSTQDTTDTAKHPIVKAIEKLFPPTKRTLKNTLDWRPKVHQNIKRVQKEKNTISQTVYTRFPLPFARAYQEFEVACRKIESEDEFNSGNLAVIQEAMFKCWRMIPNFLPFVFMSSLQAIPLEPIRNNAQAKHLLYKATDLYDKAYQYPGDAEENSPSVELVSAYLNLFRSLEKHNVLDKNFLFEPLSNQIGFDNLFPKELDLVLQIMAYFESSSIEEWLRQDNDLEVQHQILSMLQATFLRTIQLLTPLTEAFCFLYVNAVRRSSNMDINSVQGTLVEGVENKSVIFETSVDMDEDTLYLIDRDSVEGKQYGAEKIIHLSPFLMYSIRNNSHSQLLDDIFVLKIFLPSEESIDYLGLKSEESVKLQNTYNYYLKEVLKRYFKSRWKLVTKGKISPEIRTEWEILRTHMWSISEDHIDASLYERYNDRGGLNPGFSKSPFVEPLRYEMVREFINDSAGSNKTGMLLIGRSGIGKTSLLMEIYRELRKNQQLATFVSGRTLSSVNLSDYIEGNIIKKQVGNWDKAFEVMLKPGKRNVFLLIDAVNEYQNGTGTPHDLLDSIIQFVKNDRVKYGYISVIATCRTETWEKYKEEKRENRPLKSRHFVTSGSDHEAVLLEEFSEDETRTELYNQYQTYYQLSPENYTELSISVQKLIKNPFMMSLVGETYSNIGGEEGDQVVIPDRINHFDLYGESIDRKIDNALLLFGVSDKAERQEQLEDILCTFAQTIYDQTLSIVSGDSQAESVRDIIARKELRNICDVGDQFDVLIDALTQVGLLERTHIAKKGRRKSNIDVPAYLFPHDQFTQYWLHLIYEEEWGTVTTNQLEANESHLKQLSGLIRSIVENLNTPPTMIGGIEHWLYANMYPEKAQDREPDDYLLPLFEDLITNGSSSLKTFVGDYLYALIIRNLIKPEKLFDFVFTTVNDEFTIASDEFRLFFVRHTSNVWGKLPEDAFVTLIKKLGRYDEDDNNESKRVKLLTELTISLSGWFLLDSESARKFLEKPESLYKIESLTDVGTAVFRGKYQLQLMSGLVQFVITHGARDKEALSDLKTLVEAKYELVMKVLKDKNPHSFKKILYELVVDPWVAKTISGGITRKKEFVDVGDNETINATLFGEQRELLTQYYEYCVALHNDGEFYKLSMDSSSQFRELSVKMMTHRLESVAGYTACVVVGNALKNASGQVIESFIDQLLLYQDSSRDEFDERSAKASTEAIRLTLQNIAYYNESQRQTVFQIFSERLFVEDCEFYMFDSYLTGFVSASYYSKHDSEPDIKYDSESDIKNVFDKIVQVLEAQIEQEDKEEFIKVFETRIAASAFRKDLGLAELFIHHMNAQNFLDDSNWRTCLVKSISALGQRGDIYVERALRAMSLQESTLAFIKREVPQYATADMYKVQSNTIYRSGWNEFILAGVGEVTKLRYFVITSLLNSFIHSEDSKELAVELREFTLNLANGFLGDENEKPRDYTFIDLEADPHQ